MVKPLDYGRSFIHGSIPENAIRFWLESRTRVIDEKEGKTEDYYVCGSCKGENTFAEKDLFRKEGYDFLPVFGTDYAVLFRRHVDAPAGVDYRQIDKTDTWWGEMVYRLREAEPVQVLDTNEKIRKATHAGLPIVVQTEIWNDETQLRAMIEYPVKTMNIHDETNMYQIDTGPIAFPDLSRRRDRIVDSLFLAYEAINAPHFADFVLEVRTPVVEDGKRLCDVWHYSDVRSLSAKNTLFCAGDLPQE